MINYPVSEFCDRLSILKLKCERTNEISCKKELEYFLRYIDEYKSILPDLDKYVSQLYSVNCDIWGLESDIRMGKDIGLEEVGKRAISIRALNKVRVSIKNQIIRITKTGFEDIKVNHSSS